MADIRLTQPWDKEGGEAYVLTSPVSYTSIKAELQLPSSCGAPGSTFVNFYLGFETAIEAGISRSDRADIRGWNRFIRNPNHKSPPSRPQGDLAGHVVRLRLHLQGATAVLEVDGQAIGQMPCGNSSPTVKMVIAASDISQCYYDRVLFRLLGLTTSGGKSAKDLKMAGAGWQIQHALGEHVTTGGRMTMPGSDPFNFGNALPQPAGHTPTPSPTASPSPRPSPTASPSAVPSPSPSQR